MEKNWESLQELIENNKNEIHTEKMTLSKNIFKFSHTSIQISNISKIRVGKIESKVKIPPLIIIIAIISIIVMFYNLLIGLIGLLLSGGYIYYIYRNNAGDKIFLNLNLNSGDIYNIFFSDAQFAEEVRLSIESAFNGVLKTQLNIDMSSRDIYEVTGDNNSFHSGNTDNSINNSGNNNSGNSSIGHSNQNNMIQNETKFDWELIQKDLNDVIISLKNNESEIKKASEVALKLANEKNEIKFVEYVRQHKSEFTSQLFIAVSSGALVEILTRLIN